MQVDNGTLSYGGLVKKEYYCPGVLDPNQKQYFDLYIAEGDLKQYDDDASDEVKSFFTFLYMIIASSTNFAWSVGERQVNNLLVVQQAGLISEQFAAYGGGRNVGGYLRIRKFSSGETQMLVSGGNGPQFTFAQYYLENDGSITGSYQTNPIANSIRMPTQDPVVAQFNMSRNPTTNMQVATKQYVDNLALPTVTTADNGKVLKVVDGAWAIADA